MTMELFRKFIGSKQLLRTKLDHIARSAGRWQIGLMLVICTLASANVLHSKGLAAMPSQKSDRLEIQMLIIQRLVEVERLNLQGAKKGLLIYQVDAKSGYWYFDGTGWIAVSGETLKVVRPALKPEGNWILSVPGGQEIEVLAPMTRIAAETHSSNGREYDFTAQITIREGREAAFASRVRSIYPQLTALEITGTRVRATFLKETSNADINSFFNLLGCNVIQPIN